MAAPPPPPPTLNYLEQLMGSDEARQVRMREEREHARRVISNVMATQLGDEQCDEASLLAALLTTYNGDTVLREQTVEVEYLRTEQKLVLPAALGMHPCRQELSETRWNDKLIDRYWQMTRVSFAEIYDAFNSKLDPEGVRELVNAKARTRADTPYTGWLTGEEAGSAVTKKEMNVLFMFMSSALQFNCDVRDVGILLTEGMRARDGDWKTVSTFGLARLDSKLKSYSLMQIAALNFDPCKQCSLGAWVRAYGVSCGILPHSSSRTVVEYMWTTAKGSNENTQKNRTWERNCTKDVKNLCLNILGMFGLFHLNKDHTYREGDTTMERIGTSWLSTLRLVCDSVVMEYILTHKEVISRTAAHPFGLAQTYFVARLIDRIDCISPALKLRVSTTPPPVQRLMICDAAIRGWSMLPAGDAVNATYANHVELIQAGVVEVKRDPPAYSALWRLYEIEQPLTLPPGVKASVEAMSPVVAGYAEAVHGADKNEGRPQGLALALSLHNIRRECAAIVNVWTNMWNRYMDNMDKGGILRFATDAAAAFRRATGAQEAGQM